MIFRVLIVLVCVLTFTNLHAQNLDYKLSENSSNNLDNTFKGAQILTLDQGVVQATLTSTSRRNKEINWTTPEGRLLEMVISKDKIVSKDIVIQTLSSTGSKILNNIDYEFYTGYLKGNDKSQVSLLIRGDDFTSFTIHTGKKTHILTNAGRYSESAEKSDYVHYIAEDQDLPEVGCGLDVHPEFNIKGEDFPPVTNRQAGDCFTVELGIGVDFSMVQEQGSIQAAIDEVMDVMAAVAANYNLNGNINFADEVEYRVKEIVVSECADCDPWTNSTNAGDLLSSFNTWVASGGFSQDVNMASCWTNRDFGGPNVPSVGLAYRAPGLICNQSAHHVLQHFNDNIQSLRVLTAHEMGHNWSAVHDPEGTNAIMAPLVVNTSTWSADSKTDIGGEITRQGNACLGGCASTDCNMVSGLKTGNYTDNGFTVSWNVTPENSYLLLVVDTENEEIVYEETLNATSVVITPADYAACKVYRVSVRNRCGGGTFSAFTSVFAASNSTQGCADFTSNNNIDWVSGTVQFTDMSTGASSWFWEFGDGETSSLRNPTHRYESPGRYDVALTINGEVRKVRRAYIDILPREAVPYELADGGNMNAMDFGATNLVMEGSLWEKGTASSFFPQNTGWVTDLDADVPNGDLETALYSPSFNMENSGEYTFAFVLGMEAQFCNAPYAVQVQYSTNFGETWTRLGSDSDENWYNRGPNSGCELAPSIFTDRMGFNFTQSARNYSRDVSFLAGNENVVFRFVFSVAPNFNGGYGEGAYIDNVTMSGTATSVVPVELLSFEVYEKGDVHVLEWITAGEINNDGFAVEKSLDDRTYGVIANVDGAGTTSIEQAYSYVDRLPQPGLNYYRLVQRDIDGRETVYGPISIEYTGETIYRVFPSVLPRSGRLVVETNLDTKTKALLEIRSMTGEIVLAKRLSLKKGNSRRRVRAVGLSSGTYIVSLDGEVVSKLVVL